MRLLVAVSSRDVKAALFLALNGIESVSIVGTATTTAEVVSLARALRPDVVVVEDNLPGGSLNDVLENLTASASGCRVMVIETASGDTTDRSPDVFEVFTDIDQLVAAVPEHGAQS